MKKASIEITFHVDVKLALYRAAYDEAMRHAPGMFEELWHNDNKIRSELLRPAYTIAFFISET